MMLADRLDGVLTVLKALSVHCMMMAHGMDSAKVGIIRTSHDLLGEGQILATMAHTVAIFFLYWWLVASCELCAMGKEDKLRSARKWLRRRLVTIPIWRILLIGLYSKLTVIASGSL
jgi:hypothetical protein